MSRTLKFHRLILITFLTQIIIALFAINAWSQDINQQYEALMEKSETYEKFKVISRARLDALWTNVQNELNSLEGEIESFESTLAEVNKANAALTENIESLIAQLNQSEARNGSIPFLGIAIPHGVYHSTVWAIIGVLLIGLAYFGFRFKASGGVVDQLILEKESIASEFDDHKFNAHQKMLKTKRELQTALNKLEELKVH